MPHVGALFADIQGFSGLDEHEADRFVNEVLKELATRVIDHYRHKLIDLNTWGDAIFATSQNVDDIAGLALDLRDFFVNQSDKPLYKKLRIRIALHFPLVRIAPNPISAAGINGCFGGELTLPARIEPVTPPNTIFVTEPFAREINCRSNNMKAVEFEKVIHLPKNAGRIRVHSLHREMELVKVEWQDPLKKLDAVAPIAVDTWLIKDKLRYPGSPYHKNRHAEVISRLKDCQSGEEARFIAITGTSIIFPVLEVGDNLLDKSPVASALENGVQFRGIVLDPNCPEAEFRSKIESGPDKKAALLQTDAERIRGIPGSRQWQSLKDKLPEGLILKKTQRGLSFNLWLFSDRAIIEPYHFGKLEANSSEAHMCKFSQFTIFREREEEYGMLEAHFLALWVDGENLWPELHGTKTS